MSMSHYVIFDEVPLSNVNVNVDKISYLSLYSILETRLQYKAELDALSDCRMVHP
jgi:hypothetical protein